MSATLSVSHQGNDRFVIDVRGHKLTVDQPVDSGGEDTAPTPTELFVAALASCVAFYARRFCARHGIDAAGLAVTADYRIGGKPARVETITVAITAPSALPEQRREAFLAVASHCTVHNTLEVPPDTEIIVVDSAA